MVAVLQWQSSPTPCHFSLSLSLFLVLHMRQAREKVVLFLEGSATCGSEWGMEPESGVISTITCAHVTGLDGEALQSPLQQAGNYHCLSLSITDSLNSSGGSCEPSCPWLQLGGELACFLTICSPAIWKNLAFVQAAAEWREHSCCFLFYHSKLFVGGIFYLIFHLFFSGLQLVYFRFLGAEKAQYGTISSGDILLNQGRWAISYISSTKGRKCVWITKK